MKTAGEPIDPPYWASWRVASSQTLTKSARPNGTSSELNWVMSSFSSGCVAKACFKAAQYAQPSCIPNTTSGRPASLAPRSASENAAVGRDEGVALAIALAGDLSAAFVLTLACAAAAAGTRSTVTITVQTRGNSRCRLLPSIEESPLEGDRRRGTGRCFPGGRLF